VTDPASERKVPADSAYAGTRLRTSITKSSTPAPPWLAKLILPFAARLAAGELVKKYPGLGRDQILARTRDEVQDPDDPEIQQFVAEVAKRLPEAPSAAAAGPGWDSPSALMLIAANALALYGILFFGWPAFPLIALFWMENVVIGLLNALRMLLADPSDPALWGGKLLMVPFFCFHYGLFTAIHGTFVFGVFGGEGYRGFGAGIWPGDAALRAIAEFGLWLPLAVLAASHLFSFLWNYLWRGEFRRASLTELMQRPYSRVLVLHLAIISGGWLVLALGSPKWALVLLLAVKIGFDLFAHLKEHRKAAPGASAP
jgi:hypothetical protein